nr:winged helix-turn-helix transcriptional regulator [uncultured Brevundimonas sp.]
MSVLNILAVQNTALLRAIVADPLASKNALAEVTGKDRSNLNRSVAALIDAGLVEETETGARRLTDAGHTQLAAIERAEGGGEPGSPAPIAGVLALAHAQILPDPENARRDWDSDEAQDDLDALRQDIIQNGLLQNLVVRPAEPLAGGVEIVNGAGEVQALYTLVGGERRWRAIGAAIFDGDWPEDRLIPCRLLETDDLGHRLAALAENLQRRNLNPIEKAKAFEGLADAGLSNKEIAERVSSTPEHVQQHRRFLQLDEADQQRMTLAKDDPRHLSVREARQKLASKAAKDEAVITLEPMARLAWIELTHAALCQNYAWSEIIVAPDAADTIEGVQLAQIGAVEFRPMKLHGEFAGRFTARRGWSANNIVLDNPLPAELDDPEQRDSALRREQAATLGINPPPARDGAPVYATPWLANPGELTPEGVEARDQEQARLEALDRQREADRSASAERERLWAEARQRHLRLLAVAQERPEAGRPEEVAGIAHDIDRPLPWTVLPNATIVAANGTTVKAIDHYGQPNDRDLALAQMIAVAANAAGGMVTPKPAEQAVIDEDIFLDWLAAEVQLREPDLDDEARWSRAYRILETFLEENGVQFGDEGFDWTKEAAAALAGAHYEAEDDAQDEAA